MTVVQTRPRPEERPGAPAWRDLVSGRRAVWLVAAVAVALRLPLLGRPASADEAGYLVVGGQWHPGSSLYGDLWVDRPPLLITVYDLAAATGGLVPLRLIGCLAVAPTVLGVGHVARRLGGPSAAGWAALVAAALLTDPLLGSAEVDGELLAAPLVIGGIAAVLAVLDRESRGDRRRGSRWLAVGAGAALTASVLVKQNLVDVGVFAAVVVLLAWRRREISGPPAARLVGWGVVGTAGSLLAAAMWTVAHGTSLSGVVYAMYPFRLQAAHLLSTSHQQGSSTRLTTMLGAWTLSGGALLSVVGATTALRRTRSTAVWALVATLAYAVLSVLAGGSYWTHYLVQLVVPVALLAGVGLAGRPRVARPLVGLVALVALGALVVAAPAMETSRGVGVGRAIGAVAAPGDTIVTVYGHADVTQASGLRSPYPYLWSLPTKTLDPELVQLTQTLAGPSAPTWFVTWDHLSSWGVSDARAAQVLAARYRLVGDVLGRAVYLRDDVVRRTPVVTGD